LNIAGEVKPGILNSTFQFPDNMPKNIRSGISGSEALPGVQRVDLYDPEEYGGNSRNKTKSFPEVLFKKYHFGKTDTGVLF
jgi:hypothetical protein